MSIKKHIPNAITCLNLLSGSLAIVYALHEADMEVAAWLIALAAVFDFFDGMVARLLGVSSPIGKDLDSLADVVSFGVAPSVLVLHSLLMEGAELYASLPVLLIGAFAALRLAHFNNDKRQTTSFIGLPVPASALFWLGVHTVMDDAVLMLGMGITLTIVYAFVLFMGYLGLSEIPMFSFKLGAKGQKRYPLILLVFSVLSVSFLGMFGCAVSVMAYVLLSALQAYSSDQDTTA